MSDDRDSSSYGATSPVAALDSPKGAGTGRRKQVLQAQRTHRLRTQQYIRELENEVFRLRAREKDLLATIRDLEQRTSNSDPSTARGDSMEVVEGSRASPTANSAPAPDLMSVDLTALANVEPIGSCNLHPDEAPRKDYVQPPPHQWPQTFKFATLDNQAAVNFILMLEKPCLSHIKHKHLSGMAPRTDIGFVSGPGHLLNLSSTLLYEHRLEQPETTQISVSEEEIERLLETSLQLPLMDEITPVQIWTRIKELSTMYAVSEEMLKMLGEEFEKYVRCNSFGAVVDEPVVQAILSNVFNLC